MHFYFCNKNLLKSPIVYFVIFHNLFVSGQCIVLLPNLQYNIHELYCLLNKDQIVNNKLVHYKSVEVQNHAQYFSCFPFQDPRSKVKFYKAVFIKVFQTLLAKEIVCLTQTGLIAGAEIWRERRFFLFSFHYMNATIAQCRVFINVVCHNASTSLIPLLCL